MTNPDNLPRFVAINEMSKMEHVSSGTFEVVNVTYINQDNALVGYRYTKAGARQVTQRMGFFVLERDSEWRIKSGGETTINDWLANQYILSVSAINILPSGEGAVLARIHPSITNLYVTVGGRLLVNLSVRSEFLLFCITTPLEETTIKAIDEYGVAVQQVAVLHKD
ncbi:MAG: hypothetical protein HC828_10240 [Blastochloris sp.]|nr:hypothetical protein [Blastochloris sp.]